MSTKRSYILKQKCRFVYVYLTFQCTPGVKGIKFEVSYLTSCGKFFFRILFNGCTWTLLLSRSDIEWPLVVTVHLQSLNYKQHIETSRILLKLPCSYKYVESANRSKSCIGNFWKSFCSEKKIIYSQSERIETFSS